MAFKNKLARYKASVGSALGKAKGSESVGSVGHSIVEFGTHAGLALASKNMDSLGGVPVRPDTLGAVAGGLAMLVGKGKTRKLGASVLRGAGHALITRWVGSTSVSVTNGPNGPEIKVG